LLDLHDTTGIRFYLGNELREYDVGYLLLGTDSDIRGLSIPPQIDKFIVDSICPSHATRVCTSNIFLF
jgi:hypothetical protein